MGASNLVLYRKHTYDFLSSDKTIGPLIVERQNHEWGIIFHTE